MSALAIISWQERCTCASCGIEFACSIIATRRRDGQSFYCPNGHSLNFGNGEVERLRKEAQRLQDVIAARDRDIAWQKSQRETTERRLTAQKGLTTRAKNKLKRVHCGVCPDCNRSFENLRRHMETKHGVAQ